MDDAGTHNDMLNDLLVGFVGISLSSNPTNIHPCSRSVQLDIINLESQ